MSDIIPPLISSTPPPMPEFDDDEDDDDDDDFGMANGIGDLGLDFQEAAIRENKDKTLELERNGRSQDGWRSNEEQDSASQDSGLCMASHGSEGVSPLPQSDDDERGGGGGGSGGSEMRHSATVIFDKQPQSATSHPSGSNGLTNQDHDDDRSDDEFGNWTVAEDTDNTQFHNFPEPPTETKDQLCNGGITHTCLCSNHSTNDEQPTLENTTISKTKLSKNASGNIHLNGWQVDNSTVGDKCVGASDDIYLNGSQEDSSTVGDECVKASSDIHLNGSKEDSSTAYVENNCVSSVSNSNLETSNENNLCADSTHLQTTQFECEPRTNDNCVDDLSDSDDFGNFESVTIVNHNLNCVDSVEKRDVEAHSNSQAVDDDSFGEFSEPVIVDSKLNCNKICENDVRLAGTTEEGPSLGNNIASIESESVSLDKSVCQRSSENSTEDPIEGEESHPGVGDGNDDDEFNDFSDFTQSQVVENTAVVDGADDDDFDEFTDFTQSQAVEQVKADNLACGSHNTSSQDGFEYIFPKEDTETDDAKTEDLEKGAIWQQLCPLESSPALRFQWPNSRAHTKLLSALNIDSRNILFGPKWNAKIPRFAANLGSNPLQPVKASELSPAIPPANNPSDLKIQNEPETVPDAHFDWVGSGLTNPLDCGSHSALLDLEILSTFDSLPTDDTNNRNAHRTTVHKAEETVESSSSKKPNKLDNLKVLSSEAEKIISQLPDLNFMKKTYIEVLISKV
ncbi:hypothetical protein LSTR_LSTR001942 [Laodelphax striatellus]|uniref:Aftiphilin clathrin-binding box domain-containing protein n=1 Tax=Laodelphax striatellus TaxID=195883 RepID=A0A482XI45_LAOST|nr:hypothetical protein LSTR_LSTR001942 [Laodelphax striatellus]